MTVAGDDAATLEHAPDVVLDLIRGGVVSDLLLHGENESKDLLVGKAVERAGKTSETGRVSEEGVRESGSDEVDGVC